MPSIAESAVDPDEIIARIKQTPPASIAFSEVRYSKLLQKPIEVSGELGYLGPGRLDRRVEKPYAEVTEIRDASVRVMRAGEPTRDFALDRTPELRVMLLAFSSLLGGDRPTIEREFKLTTEGDQDHWQLQLEPRDARVHRRIKNVEIFGGAKPRCFIVRTSDGGISIMKLGSAWQHSATPSPDAILNQCRTES